MRTPTHTHTNMHMHMHMHTQNHMHMPMSAHIQKGISFLDFILNKKMFYMFILQLVPP